ncbi:DNA-directed RNA polymerase subunit beta [Bacillus sp. 2205SS5-2]|uniref:DNA-directed RNA polymerase subunit beta n=1 Tax=Bacillus sp. 2205SS5-2 TaxID=3109031 RepID=UPI0030071948
MTEKNIKQKATTREELKENKKPKKSVRIRLIPIWLRVIIVTLLVTASLAGGLMVGYGYLGDGKPTDVFHKSTWTHIGEIVTSDKQEDI